MTPFHFLLPSFCLKERKIFHAPGDEPEYKRPLSVWSFIFMSGLAQQVYHGSHDIDFIAMTN